MKYIRPKEAIEAAGISEQKLRHWKRCLSPLRNKRGNTASFSMGDVLALRVIHWLTDTAAISVSRLNSFAPALFRLCQTEAWPRTEHLVAVLKFEKKILETIPRNSALSGQALGGVLVLDIGRLITEFRAQHFGGQPFGQNQGLPGPVALSQSSHRQKRVLKRLSALPTSA